MRNTDGCKIYLIRHGKTVANERKLYCGATDLLLSEAGIAEILELKGLGVYPGCMGEQLPKATTSPGCMGEQLPKATTSPESVDFYFTSGLARTEQTLDLIYGSVDRVAISEFAEFDFGGFEMKSYEMLKERDDYQAWITDDAGGVYCPDGECRQDFTRRVLRGFEMLTEEWQGDLFVVCHGGVIVSIMEHLFPNTKNFYEWQPQPGRGYSLDLGGFKLYQPI